MYDHLTPRIPEEQLPPGMCPPRFDPPVCRVDDRLPPVGALQKSTAVITVSAGRTDVRVDCFTDVPGRDGRDRDSDESDDGRDAGGWVLDHGPLSEGGLGTQLRHGDKM